MAWSDEEFMMNRKLQIEVRVKRDVFDTIIRVCVCLGAACLGEFMLALGSVVLCGPGTFIPASAIAVVGIGSLVSAWVVTR